MEQEHLSGLIRKFADHTASPAEIQELQDWYQSIHSVEAVEWPAVDPAERQKLQQRMLEGLERRLQDPAPETAPETGMEPGTGTGTRIALPRIYHLPWVRVAACMLLVAAVWVVVQSRWPQKPDTISIYNPSGKIQHIDLPDHSQVWLNAASSLRYARAFTGQRELYLEGEAYFDVVQDRDHPFVVHAGALTTRVLGTTFDIKSFAGERNHAVTVIRGKVQVDNEGRVLDVLTPARQLQWDNQARQGRTLSVDTNQVLGWQQGKLLFQGETMEEIAATLGRWYNLRFEFKDSAVRQCRLYVHFGNTQPLEEIVTSISLVIDLKFVINRPNRTVTLSGKGCL